MKKNAGVTIVSMLVIIIVLVILASITIFGGIEILTNSKDSQKKENLTAVQTVVNNISTKLNVAGVLTPGDTKLYGTDAATLLEKPELKGWYVLEKEDLEELGITYLDETYLVNYKENRVVSMTDYANNGI